MNFTLDLLDSIIEDAPLTALSVVQNAADSGQHLVVRRFVEDQIENNKTGASLGVDQPGFIKSMMTLAGFADSPTNIVQAGETFTQWAEPAFANHPQRTRLLCELLSNCAHSIRPSFETAGHELLRLGADPLTLSCDISSEQAVELSGVKIGLQERNATLVGRALAYQHPLASDLVKRSSSSKNPWPAVSEVNVDGVFYPVNAASYCLTIGDAKMLRMVCRQTSGSEYQKNLALAQAIDFALSSGLTNRCTPEVAQCIALCIANGADLDFNRIGQRLATHRTLLADEVSDFKFQTDRSHLTASLFMSPSNGRDALLAISKLVNDYALDINAPVTETGTRASFLHYAAISGQPDLVRGLIKLGANDSFVDAKGMTALQWAQVFDRKSIVFILDPSARDGVNELPECVDNKPVQSLPVVETRVNNLNPQVDTRDQIAASMTVAQASKGAALFAKIKSSQATLAAKPAVIESQSQENSSVDTPVLTAKATESIASSAQAKALRAKRLSFRS